VGEIDLSNKSQLVTKPAAVKPSFSRKDDRGLFVEIVTEGPWETVIHGTMKSQKKMGNHYHRENKAFFFLTRGRAQVTVKHIVDGTSDEIVLGPGEGIYFLPFEIHTITYLEDSDFILLKSYRYNSQKPDIFINDQS
jgi:mannose-6-phosphate isomerase-like protein (cupin superfamily)